MSESLFSSFHKKPWLQSMMAKAASKKGVRGQIHFVGREEKIPASVIKTAPAWVKNKIKEGSPMVFWSSQQGPVWLLKTSIVESKDHYGHFSPSAYAMARDLTGSCLRQVLSEKVSQLSVSHIGQSMEEFQGLCAGLETVSYTHLTLPTICSV